MHAPADLVPELRAALGDDNVVVDPDIVETYRHDRAPFAAAGRPLAVVRARSTDHVQKTMRLAARHGVPVVPRGAGSGLAGGSNAVDGAVTLCVEAMDRVLHVDEHDHLAVVEPGVLNLDLKQTVAEVGLWYPPDPASQAFCSVGGNLATNAGGLCCVKYGVTRDWVLGLEAVLADGRLLRTGRRTRKGVAGYDLTGLFVGSEGTLGVITQATVRLCPKPAPASTLVAFFDTLEAAGEAVAAIGRTPAPSLLELMDNATICAVDDWKRMDLDRDAAVLLLAQSDEGTVEARRAQMAVIERACRDSGATYAAASDDPEEGEQLLTARRLAYPALERLGVAILDDVAVPRSRLAAFLAEMPRLADRHGLLLATYGHAGDGNMHPTLVFDPTSADEEQRGRALFGAIVDVALELGGTSTGEHGIGALKQRWLAPELGEVAIDLHHRLKAALDPAGLLNPGKVLGPDRLSLPVR